MAGAYCANACARTAPVRYRLRQRAETRVRRRSGRHDPRRNVRPLSHRKFCFRLAQNARNRRCTGNRRSGGIGAHRGDSPILSRAARATLATLLMIFASSAAIERTTTLHLATAAISAAKWPYFPGTRLALRVSGIVPPYGTAIVGPGIMLGAALYGVPLNASPGNALLVTGNAAGIGELH